MMAKNLQSACILVLEDEPTQLSVLAFNLANAGFRVSAAAEAGKALSLAEHQHFDLAIVDYYLPDCAGTDFVKRLRETDRYKHVPVIFLTARAEELNLEYLRSEFSAVVLAKPCSMNRLIDTVLKCLAADHSVS